MTLNQVVNKATSTTTVSSSLNPSRVTNAVTFTARVTPTAAVGTVQFRIDGVLSAAVTLDATGRATLSRTFVAPAATHTVVAVYSGSADYNTSSSGNLNQVVNP